MARWLIATGLVFVAVVAPATAGGITGQYIEARTCDVWVAPCFANSEMNLSGKHALLGWKVDRGTLDDVRIDGLAVVAVVAASDTLGLEQTGPARAMIIVDASADARQRDALVRLAKKQAGELLDRVVAVKTASINFTTCKCQGGACATLDAGQARVQTRCIDGQHDKTCGNEKAFYPPLAKDVNAQAAVAVESRFSGSEFNATWKEAERRGAYVGSFTTP